MQTLTSTRLLFTVTQKRRSKSLKRLWLRTISQCRSCTVRWTNSRETLSWSNSDLVQFVYSSQLIYLLEVLMSSKSVSLSTTNFPIRRKTTFTELVELVVSAERVPLSISFCPRTLFSSSRSKSITTLRLTRCQLILMNSEQSGVTEKASKLLITLVGSDRFREWQTCCTTSKSISTSFHQWANW